MDSNDQIIHLFGKISNGVRIRTLLKNNLIEWPEYQNHFGHSLAFNI